jgi:hypothetical protein
MRARGVRFTITCNHWCRATAEMTATPATVRALARRRIAAAGVMARGSYRHGAHRSLRLKLTPEGLRALRRVPAGSYTVTITLTSWGGTNPVVVTRSLRFTASR